MDITTLAQAVQASNARDAFAAGLSLPQWQVLAPYLARRVVRAGEMLIRQGDGDRNTYLVEQGNLQVFMTGGPPGSQRVAVLRPGSLVGEPALFAATPRAANVEAMTPGAVWALGEPQLEAMCTRAPELALRLLRAAGAVMVVRSHANARRGLSLG